MDCKPVILPTLNIAVRGRVTKRIRSLGDTGASSSLISYEFAAAILGENILEKEIYTGGYLPTFKTADSRYTTLKVRLTFEIRGQPFTHIFYVLDKCAENIILGASSSPRVPRSITEQERCYSKRKKEALYLVHFKYKNRPPVHYKQQPS
jgi:hypothetical protein